LRYRVFIDGKQADEFALSAAYMFGPDMVPLRYVERIEFKKGLIECSRKGSDSAGLALLWPVKDFGRFLLHTTRLPERDEPYNLNLELARARLMQITLKREDWAIFEEDDTFAQQAHEAHELFIQALQSINDPPQASALADESLHKGLIFSEKLASRHAEQFLSVRLRNRGLSRHSLGCVMDLDRMEDQQYRKGILEMFGFITIPVNWAEIETEKGEYDFSGMDRCIDHIAGKRLAVGAGPLLRFCPEYVPAWLSRTSGEFEKVREQAYEFVNRIISRYSKYIHIWRVISGINALNCFGFTFEQVIEMTRTACLAAKAADHKSRKIVEIINPWGEYYAEGASTVPPLIYADTVLQSGIPFDGFGLQLHFGLDKPGMHLRDMMEISSLLDCFAPVNKPLHITALAVPDRSDAAAPDGERAGWWRRQWSPGLQAEWLEQVYKLALGRPFITSVTYSQLADSDKDLIAGSGLLDGQLKPKKAFMTIAKFQKTILKHL